MDNSKDLGIAGEKDVCRILRKLGCPVRKSDGHIIINEILCFIETKNKTRHWNAPPFDGHGTDKSTIEHYLKLHQDYGLRTILFVPGKTGGWIWNYIDVLIQGKSHRTKSELLVFPFDNYLPLDALEHEINPPSYDNFQLADFMRGDPSG